MKILRVGTVSNSIMAQNGSKFGKSGSPVPNRSYELPTGNSSQGSPQDTELQINGFLSIEQSSFDAHLESGNRARSIPRQCAIDVPAAERRTNSVFRLCHSVAARVAGIDTNRVRRGQPLLIGAFVASRGSQHSQSFRNVLQRSRKSVGGLGHRLKRRSGRWNPVLGSRGNKTRYLDMNAMEGPATVCTYRQDGGS